MTYPRQASSGLQFVRRRRRFLPAPPEVTVFDVPPLPAKDGPPPFQPAMLLLPFLTSGSFLIYGFIVHQFSLVILGLLVTVGAVATPFLMVLGGKWTADKRNKQRAEGFAELVGEVKSAAERANEAARQALKATHPAVADPPEHEDPVRAWAARGRLWERRLTDQDFLSVQLGWGDIPTGFTINVGQASPGSAGVIHSKDATAAERLAREVRNAPLCLSLRDHPVLSIEGPRDQSRPLAEAILAQLLLACGPDELALLVAAPGQLGADWAWVNQVPHALAVPRETDEDEVPGGGRMIPPGLVRDSRELARALTQALNARAQRLADDDPLARQAIPHLVLVLDNFSTDPRSADRYPVPALHQLLDQAAGLSVSVVAICADPGQTPAEAAAVLSANPQWHKDQNPDMDPRRWHTMRLRRTAQADRPFMPLNPPADLAGRVTGQVSGRVLVTDPAFGEDSRGALLLDLLQYRGRLDRELAWECTHPADERFLTARVGVRADGRNFTLNLRESNRDGSGPHGLVVGATGSGKSELLRTLVTSLALTHSPDVLRLALVDFKGGAAFAPLERLPHCAALITNIEDDPTLVDRLRAALSGVLDDRELALLKASAKAGGEVPDILAYWHVRQSFQDDELEPMPCLLVVIDEFAELTETHPDFLDLLARIGAKGRSLGVHLLLSSQAADSGQLRKLDQHLSYRIALRTFTAEQSVAAIRSRVAATLPHLPGHGYFWTANSPLVRFKTSQVSAAAPGRRSDLDQVLGWLSGAGKADTIWLPPLPSTAHGDHLAMDGDEMAAALPQGSVMPVAVGVVDLPERRSRELAVFDSGRFGGHVAVFGAPQSGKSTVLVTAVLQAARTYAPDALRFFIIDCGGGTLDEVSVLPNVAAYATPQQPDRIDRVMSEVLALLDDPSPERGGHGAGRRTVLLIDGYDAFKDRYPEHAGVVASALVEGHGRRLYVHLSTGRPADLTLAMQDLIGTRFELRLNESALAPHDGARTAIQSAGPGRGLTSARRQVQFAAPALGSYGPGQLDEVVAAVRAEAEDRWNGVSTRRLEMLDALTAQEFDKAAMGTHAGQLLIGVGESSRSERAVRFRPGMDGSLLLYGDPGTGKTATLWRFLAADHGSLLGRADVYIVDLRGELLARLGLGPGAPGTASSLPAVTAVGDQIAAALKARMESREPAGVPRPLVLVVDDYELLYAMRSQGERLLSGIAPFLYLGQQLGFSAIISQVAAGSQAREHESVLIGAAQSGAGRLYFSSPSRAAKLAGDYWGRRQPPGVADYVSLGQPPGRVRLLPPG